eukprot:CAMPEP_0181179280 /NCGR_PEP_ID=MMETSP1096-20121128/6176_1 /TAXON_ID=156174 ORGANISM="Chrysochromulina ericina, Strain CCMP281" /NCGR_SAMPLE_ID=MMETSP1096 /ASSEMBLY_ACC=CAM_ASM_000453 /LENGTH=121 /DNA_ID=CAMNT_0023267619 /DNA_START=425 /DNA_END=787 /DNA_ORIENTATION=-
MSGRGRLRFLLGMVSISSRSPLAALATPIPSSPPQVALHRGGRSGDHVTLVRSPAKAATPPLGSPLAHSPWASWARSSALSRATACRTTRRSRTAPAPASAPCGLHWIPAAQPRSRQDAAG